MQRQKSSELFKKAKNSIPGGVNSPVRAYSSVGGNPLFIKRAAGSQVYDVDGNVYIDYVGSWGPMILGHCHPEVVAAIQYAATTGASFGAPTEVEIGIDNHYPVSTEHQCEKRSLSISSYYLINQ